MSNWGPAAPAWVRTPVSMLGQFLLAFCHSSWVMGGWIAGLYAGAEPLQGNPVHLTPVYFIGWSHIVIREQISLDLHPVSPHLNPE
ncbi:hypothetical protein MHYP_G00245330 [Metynnis hypsauchen]